MKYKQKDMLLLQRACWLDGVTHLVAVRFLLCTPPPGITGSSYLDTLGKKKLFAFRLENTVDRDRKFALHAVVQHLMIRRQPPKEPGQLRLGSQF